MQQFIVEQNLFEPIQTTDFKNWILSVFSIKQPMFILPHMLFTFRYLWSDLTGVNFLKPMKHFKYVKLQYWLIVSVQNKIWIKQARPGFILLLCVCQVTLVQVKSVQVSFYQFSLNQFRLVYISFRLIYISLGQFTLV